MEGKGTRLKKRGGVWYIVWTGNSRGRSTGTGDRARAERRLAAFISDGGHDGQAEPAGVTVNDVLALYWNHARTLPSAEQVAIASDFLRASMGDRRVADLTADDFATYDAQRRSGELQRSEHRKPRPVGDSTIRRELGVLSTACHYTSRQRDPLTKLPILAKTDLPHVTRPSRPPARDVWMTAEQEAAWFAACPVEHRGRLTRIYRFAMIASRAAARKEAIETLTWPQVDLEANFIDFNPAGRRQTKKRRPRVRMADDLRAVLARARSEAASFFVLDHPGNVRRSVETVSARAGLPQVTPHVFRHTWATRSARAGVSMRDIADVLGDDIATVERNYMHHHPDFQKGVVNWREKETSNALASNPDDSVRDRVGTGRVRSTDQG